MIARLPGHEERGADALHRARDDRAARRSAPRPHPTDASAKTATPAANTRRRPKRSPSAPPTRSSAARNSAYASTTHWTSAIVACRRSAAPGSATLTTVPSMNAMLEPRIETTSTQRPAPNARASGFPARAAPSSHGNFRTLDTTRGPDSTRGPRSRAAWRFERGAVPPGEIRAEFVRRVHEREDRLLGRIRGTHGFVRQDELAELAVVVGGVRPGPRPPGNRPAPGRRTRRKPARGEPRCRARSRG